jgi:hypothetical protein
LGHQRVEALDMKGTILLLMTTLLASSAQGASYEQIGGTIVDPIQLVSGGNHSYAGPNLESGAFLSGAALSNAELSLADLSGAVLNNAVLNSANLSNADLTSTDLSGANLTNADLTHADLADADLSGAVMIGADLTCANLANTDSCGTNLSGANLSGADLSNALLLSESTGSPFYDSSTDFTGTGFDPVAAGWAAVVPALGTWGLVLLVSGILLGVQLVSPRLRGARPNNTGVGA